MIKLELSEQVIAQVMDALSKQPLAQSFDAFVTIRGQLAAQQRPPMPAGQQAMPTTPPNGHSE